MGTIENRLSIRNSSSQEVPFSPFRVLPTWSKAMVYFFSSNILTILSFNCRSLFSLFLYLTWILSIVDQITVMAQTNTTIDDSDPAFSFPGVNWNAITPSTPCGGCATKLDLSQTYNNTYHDGDFDTSGPMTGSFQFEGNQNPHSFNFLAQSLTVYRYRCIPLWNYSVG